MTKLKYTYMYNIMANISEQCMNAELQTLYPFQ